MAKHGPGVRRHLLDARGLVSASLGLARGPVGRGPHSVLRVHLRFPFDLEYLAYWSQSYWGGTVAALGGALVFGALPRIMKKQRLRDALWLALGLAILANSRPFEGLVVSIPVAVVLGIWIIRTRLSVGVFGFTGSCCRWSGASSGGRVDGLL